MTVIAGKVYKDKVVLAADSQTTAYYQIIGKCSKIIETNTLAIGSCGYAREIQFMRIFLQTNMPKSSQQNDLSDFFIKFHEFLKEKDKSFNSQNTWLMVFEQKLIEISSDLYIEYHDIAAIGSGMNFALAALHLGHSPKEAVKVACDLTIYCSGEILEVTRKI